MGIDMEAGVVYTGGMIKKPNTTRELKNWCEESEERVLKNLDIAFDKLDINNKEVKQLMEEASNILQEIEGIKTELMKNL
jgi:hypothetical protein